jgi:hypothetical protein
MIQTILALAAALAFLLGSVQASALSHHHGGIATPADAILPGPV